MVNRMVYKDDRLSSVQISGINSKNRELHNQFAWGDENWSDEQKREYLLSGGFRVYSDGKKFEIRPHTGKMVSSFDPSIALVAYGKSPSYR
jgi:hypothetical protein